MKNKEEIKKCERCCIVCGSRDDITEHHMRDIHSKKNRKKEKLNGIIYLCRSCHDIVEDIVNKGKSKKIWFNKGYELAEKEILEKIERFIEKNAKRVNYGIGEDDFVIAVEDIEELKKEITGED
jgi:hypothetical protein